MRREFIHHGLYFFLILHVFETTPFRVYQDLPLVLIFAITISGLNRQSYFFFYDSWSRHENL